MQGHRADARRWIALAVSAAMVGMLALMIGWPGNLAGAATDGLAACATPTALPTGTPATGTSGPSPTATATAPQIIGRLLGDVPATATATASPTPLPSCTPTPVPTKVPPTPATIGVATATVSVSAVRNGPPTTAPPPATIAPPAAVARTSAQEATAPASVTAPVVAAPSPPSASSSSGPPAAAVGLPPPPPPGYAVGNTPNSAGGANAAGFPPAVGTPVVSAARGNIAPAGAASIPFPASAPVAARSVAPPGYAIGPTGAPVPVVTPRAGRPRSDCGTGLALLVGVACLFAGMRVRRNPLRQGNRIIAPHLPQP